MIFDGVTRLSYSLFYQKDKSHPASYLPNTNKVFTGSGRCALKLAIKLMGLSSSDVVLLPSFIPDGALTPFSDANIKKSFYPLKQGMAADSEAIKKLITPSTKALLLIHYYGFRQDISKIRAICDRNSIFLIEDCAQAFLSDHGGKPLGVTGDLSIFSLSKILPVPDGGVLVVNNQALWDKDKAESSIVSINPLHSIYVFLRLLAVSSFTAKIRGFFFLSYKMLTLMPKPSGCSFISLRLLSKFSFDEIVARRRENYAFLKSAIGKKYPPIFGALKPGDCPFAYPVLADNRIKFHRGLLDKGIYCATSNGWNFLSNDNGPEYKLAHAYFDHIILIPVSQHLTKKEMRYLADSALSIE